MSIRNVVRPACAALAVLVAGAGFSGCGDAEEGSKSTATKSPAAAGSSAATSVAAGKTPVKIMAQSAVGTPSFSTPGVWAAAISAAAAANRDGELGSDRAIQVITCNDKQTANGATACARKAIDEKVVAVVGYTGFTFVEAPVLAKAGIPMLNLALAESDLKFPNLYAVNGAAYAPEFSAMGLIAKRLAAKRIVSVTVKFPGVEAGVALEKKALKSQGLSVAVDDIPTELTQSDFSSVVQKLRSADADAVLLNTSGPQIISVLQAAKQTGYDPNWILPVGAQSGQILKTASGLSDKLNFSATTPDFLAPGDTTYPSIVKMRKEMAAFGGENGSLANQDESSVYCWYTTHALIDVIAKTKGTVSAAGLTATLKKTRDVDVNGLWNWSPSDRYPDVEEPRVFVGHAEDGYAKYDARLPILAAMKG